MDAIADLFNDDAFIQEVFPMSSEEIAERAAASGTLGTVPGSKQQQDSSRYDGEYAEGLIGLLKEQRG